MTDTPTDEEIERWATIPDRYGIKTRATVVTFARLLKAERAENKRLRFALRLIAAGPKHPGTHEPVPAADIARMALGED